jgi:hypothetical protein
MERSATVVLGHGAKQGAVRPLRVANSKGDAVAVAKVKLSHVAMKVLLPSRLIEAAHSTLEDGEEALDDVGVDFAPPIFASAVADVVVTGEVVREFLVLTSLIGEDDGFWRCSRGEWAGGLWRSGR